MIKLAVIPMIFILLGNLYGQQEGNKWVIGYYSNGSPEYSVMQLDFSGPALVIDWHFDETMHVRETSSNICNSIGDVILWTNGMQVFGKDGFRILDTIAFEDNVLGYWNWYNTDTYGPLGFFRHEGALILPVPGSSTEYAVLYHYAEYHSTLGFPVDRFLEARVKMNSETTFQPMYKDSLIGNMHNFYSPHLVATRHANGRDWWIVTFERDGNKYFSFLLQPAGIKLMHEGTVDIEMEGGLGQTAFSYSGNYIARSDALTVDDGQYIYLFSFDRCTGRVESKERLHTSAGYFTGVAFSPNERYLYGDDNTHLWQWDLQADDIAMSQTLVDTFDGFIQPGWLGMDFGPMKTTPDGRIYIIPSAGSSEFMHVIERPDFPADQVQFRQHSIDLKVPNGCSAPNIPNYRLGPLDGNPCDTLGIDNIPVANFRFAEYVPGEVHDIQFTDLSYYNPESWVWEFGDGATSTEIHPQHNFEDGLYHVCLTVLNSNGSDSTCQWVEIITTSIEEKEAARNTDLTIYPNPFHNELQIRSQSGTLRSTHLQLFDIHGKLVLNQTQAPVPVNIHLPNLPSGMYLCVIKEKDGTVYSFKVMKL